ncbi:unnamed protein product [Ambrosiozyma monospora]|uniref:Unnamed protein product n=1 Tax=Ambrosiozyma monospora TaxID=43982 RepID=A0ACB5SXG8_AMBMO|nr:unnamed protein product [Ambrosiozyma monospora]
MAEKKTDKKVEKKTEKKIDKKAEYEKLKKQLKAAINRKKDLDQQLAKLEEDIFNKETKYLSEGAAHGNIIKGFENFTKNSSSSSARNKKIQFTDEDRIFSLSSSTYVRHLKRINASNANGGMNAAVSDDEVDSEGTGSSRSRKR